jgi:hypothetical protein
MQIEGLVIRGRQTNGAELKTVAGARTLHFIIRPHPISCVSSAQPEKKTKKRKASAGEGNKK